MDVPICFCIPAHRLKDECNLMIINNRHPHQLGQERKWWQSPSEGGEPAVAATNEQDQKKAFPKQSETNLEKPCVSPCPQNSQPTQTKQFPPPHPQHTESICSSRENRMLRFTSIPSPLSLKGVRILRVFSFLMERGAKTKLHSSLPGR